MFCMLYVYYVFRSKKKKLKRHQGGLGILPPAFLEAQEEGRLRNQYAPENKSRLLREGPFIKLF